MTSQKNIIKKIDRKYSVITLKDFLKLVLCHILIVGILMYVNTTGDTKFGESGWLLYWPFWGIFYSIPLIITVIFTRVFKLHRKLSRIICYSEVITASIMLEVIWIFDLDYIGNLNIISLIIIFSLITSFLRSGRLNVKNVLLLITLTLSIIISLHCYFVFRES